MVSTELLRRYPLFSSLSFYMLDEIALISEELVLEKGSWVFHEKEEATKFYMILEGKVALTMYIFQQGEPQHTKMTESITVGEFLGWSSIVKPHKYTLGARTENRTRLLIIEAEPLRQLMDDNPENGYHLMKNIAEVISERLIFKCIQLLSLVLEEENNLKVLT